MTLICVDNDQKQLNDMLLRSLETITEKAYICSSV